MKTIHRHPAPHCLEQQSENQDWYAFMQTRCHEDVRVSLWKEQQGICCYCEIELADNNVHIEHMEPRCRNSARTYDYANLALSCNGGTVEHCGHYKDNRAHNPGYAWDGGRFSPPHDSETAMLFMYLTDGSVAPTEVNEDKASYLIGYLGLTCARLTERRKAHARVLIDSLGYQPEQNAEFLRQYYLEADNKGRLKQFFSLSKQILEP
ncbi:MAG TPA: TIGR02646 family protein [Defluviicoccus sp.]|nr:TIGR02646 family protein [Defluviicoccus sp.]